jgi:hypothetical protein
VLDLFLGATYPLLAACIAHPLFSSTYELLFSQLPCFQKVLRCPMFFPKSYLPKEDHMAQQTAKPRFINNSTRDACRFSNRRETERLSAAAHSPLARNF